MKVVEDVHDLGDWRISVNKRLEEFDFRINAKLLGERFPKIMEYSKRLYGQLGYIKSIFLNPIDEGLKITIIHSNDDRIQAINQSEKIFEEIEDAFPDLNIEFMVLHKSEIIDPSALKGERIDFPYH